MCYVSAPSLVDKGWDMPISSLIKLFVLAAIWGASFLFMRVGVPALGPVWLIAWRVVLAALFLWLIGYVLKKSTDFKQHWRHFLIIGLLNAALPFTLIALAAKVLSTSLLTILNATTPIWAAVLHAVWTRQLPTPKVILGLLIGIGGVAILVGFDRISFQPGAGMAILASLGATLCYALATTYAKLVKQVEPFANAHGSMWAALAWLLPLLPWLPMNFMPDTGILFAVLLLGILCTGIAFLLYFQLVAEIGTTATLTVTFLIPVFGTLWGYLVLQEAVHAYMLAGAATVLLGTALVTDFSPKSLLNSVNKRDLT